MPENNEKEKGAFNWRVERFRDGVVVFDYHSRVHMITFDVAGEGLALSFFGPEDYTTAVYAPGAWTCAVVVDKEDGEVKGS